VFIKEDIFFIREFKGIEEISGVDLLSPAYL
jgi:hypothetical protein